MAWAIAFFVGGGDPAELDRSGGISEHSRVDIRSL